MAGLTVKVPIRFSDKAQKDLYETCMAYKELAEIRGAENDKLRELAADMLRAMRRMEESAGMDVMVGHSPWFAPKLHELGIEVEK